jgi:outer membrane biosynthesis protein TonB
MAIALAFRIAAPTVAAELLGPHLASASAAVLLLLLTAGCARVTPETPVSQPQVVATQPATPQPAAKPAAPETPRPAPAAVRAPTATTPAPQAASKAAKPAARTPAPTERAPKPAVPPVAAPPAPAAPLTLDLNALKEQLKKTKAIGIFTKIALKNQVDDLLDQFREYYQGKAKITMTELRRSYNLLLMKVLSLLQDADQKLAAAIVSSREAIWILLSDSKKFATLQS